MQRAHRRPSHIAECTRSGDMRGREFCQRQSVTSALWPSINKFTALEIE